MNPNNRLIPERCSTPLYSKLARWLLPLALCMPLPGFADSSLRVDRERIEQGINHLGGFGTNPEGGVSRVAFSQADLDARKYLRTLMAKAGLEVRVDAAGNLLGRRAGSEDLPLIMIGSHADSVPGGGNYDGQVGVIGAIEVATRLHEANVQLRHPLEVVVFVDEEGGLTGSRAMVGTLTPDALAVVGHSGLSVAEGISRLGGDPNKLTRPLRNKGDIAAFIELHIEQGAILDEADIDIGVVTGIVGIEWWDITLTGVANHGGTTPMNNRQDPMLAAAELALAVNRIVRAEPGAQVATVGRIHAEPGAPNVIPGKVVMSLEIRDLDQDKIWRLFQTIEGEAASIGQRQGVEVEFSYIDAAAPPAMTDPAVRNVIGEAASALGYSVNVMPSGAGHDTQDMAHIAPTGMIFVPSRGGVSHSPHEYTAPEHMANGANVLLHTVLTLDRQ